MADGAFAASDVVRDGDAVADRLRWVSPDEKPLAFGVSKRIKL